MALNYLPRDAMIARLEDAVGHPLIAPENIHDADLRAIFTYIVELYDGSRREEAARAELRAIFAYDEAED